MNPQNLKTTVKQNFIFYLTGFLVIFGLKYFYSKAGSDELTWILTPTTRWVSILSGISFTYVSGTGYVNHNLKYVIAPSCCGVQFMIITIAMLIFSFVHRINSETTIPAFHYFRSKTPASGSLPAGTKGFFWIFGSIAFSYLITIFVNGLRIILAVYIPLYLEDMQFYSPVLTPDRLHTLIGTAVYFTALLIIYHLTESFFLKITSLPETSAVPSNTDSGKTGHSPHSCRRLLIRKCLSPVFWYFFIVLGIPFLNRAYKNGAGSFTEFAILITSVCFMIILLLCLLLMLRKHLRVRKLLS